jgi:glutathione S-transferase
MSMTAEPVDQFTIIGRSSSHFTRVTRIFAAELGVPYTLQVVRDLLSCDAAEYGGNPALKLPVLKTANGVWYGALNVCRTLARSSPSRSAKRIIWPEDLADPLPANAQELVLQAMATEVSLVMAKAGGATEQNTHVGKMKRSLTNTLAWLDDNSVNVLDRVGALAELSFLEVSLFCFVTHLEFREVMSVSSYAVLDQFCRRFSQRSSARDTPYRYDT